MHDWLFANQQTWETASDMPAEFRKQALALGADAAKFDACLTDAATEQYIQKDMQEGASRGVQGTPAFFINDWFISGAYPFDEFKDKIEKAKQGIKPAPTPTPLPEGKDFYDPDPARPGLTYDGSPTLGSNTAPVALVVFDDFKNVDAAKYANEIEPTLKKDLVDANTLRIVSKFYPVTAPKAAAAAWCAAQQGKYWEFRTLLYQKQGEWGEGDNAAMTAFAKQVGADEAKFTACLQDPATTSVITAALDFAQNTIGVPAAPSFLLLKFDETGKLANGKGIAGLQTLDALKQEIANIQLPPTPVPTQPPPVSEAQLASLEAGVTADGHFYRGSPQAPIRMEDFSDFQ
jgi:protein-disulfide isomerase